MKQYVKQLRLTELMRALESGETTAVETVQRCLARIRECEPTVGAFLTVDAEGALSAAAAADERRRNGHPLHPMDGIPFAVKDNFCTSHLPTTCASHVLEGYIPPYRAEAVERLQSIGCILLGKLNMDEFAMGSSTQHSALGVTRNPWDPERVPGGSSGGSAAAVAAGEVPFALGSDTGGSVRQPASFCGVMGLKPTFGAVSRYGMMAFASSLDCVGIVANTAEDTAWVLDALAGKDPKDATTLSYPKLQPAEVCDRGVRGLRIAVVPDAGTGRSSAEVESSVAAACAALQAAGAVIETADLPSPEDALLSYCAVSAVEAASNFARFDGIRFGRSQGDATTTETAYETARADFGSEVKQRILLGTALLTEGYRERYYLPACRLREEVTHTLRELLKRYDIVLKPTTPSGAFRFDEEISPLQMREMDLCTVYASLAGIPAMSVPMGADRNGMPLGIQIMAGALREDLVLRCAAVLETHGQI